MTREEIINFWIESSDHDFEVMNRLFINKDYDWALFVGHLSVEKLLKAYYVKVVGEQIPHIHDLNRIAKLSNLELIGETQDLLDIVTTFNISVRYPDYKLKFYKKCTQEYSEKYIKEISNFLIWLKKKF